MPAVRRALIAGVVAAASVAFAALACSDDSTSSDGPCLTDGDCKHGRRCTAGTCRSNGTSDGGPSSPPSGPPSAETCPGDERTLRLATPSQAAAAIAVDESHVYWTESTDGVVRRVKKNGATPETVATGQLRAGPIAVTSEHVYWVIRSSIGDGGVISARDGAVMRASKVVPGAPVVVASALFNPTAIHAVGDRVFFGTSGNDGGVWIVNGAPPPTRMTALTWGPLAFASAGNMLWFGYGDLSAGNGKGAVYRATGAGTAEKVVDTEEWVTSIAADDSHAYFAQIDKVSRVPAAGGAAEVFSDDFALGPRGLIALAGNVYWANQGDRDTGSSCMSFATIVRSQTSAVAPSALVGRQFGVEAMVSDGVALFFTRTDPFGIHRVAP